MNDIKQILDSIEYNPDKCEEIINNIVNLLIENDCSEVEIDYIFFILCKILNKKYLGGGEWIIKQQ